MCERDRIIRIYSTTGEATGSAWESWQRQCPAHGNLEALPQNYFKFYA